MLISCFGWSIVIFCDSHWKVQKDNPIYKGTHLVIFLSPVILVIVLLVCLCCVDIFEIKQDIVSSVQKSGKCMKRKMFEEAIVEFIGV